MARELPPRCSPSCPPYPGEPTISTLPVSRKASAWPHLMPRMKNGVRKPPGDALPAAVPVGYRGFMPPPLACHGHACAPPSPYFPNTSCCPLHTGHVRRQHLHPVPFCGVSHSVPCTVVVGRMRILARQQSGQSPNQNSCHSDLPKIKTVTKVFMLNIDIFSRVS